VWKTLLKWVAEALLSAAADKVSEAGPDRVPAPPVKKVGKKVQ
jgi:hypothetical protein